MTVLSRFYTGTKYNNFLIVAPKRKTISDKSYYNFRSRGIKQESLKNSIIKTGKGKCNRYLVDVLVNNIDDELTRLSDIIGLKASFIGAQIVNSKKFLEKLKVLTGNFRIYNEVVKIVKINNKFIVKTTDETINCKKVIFCTGGNRSKFSHNFNDEKTSCNAFEIVQNIGCKTEALNKIMYHPFYSKGICIPSDNLFGFDIVNEKGQRLINIYQLIRAHNAHHCFDEIIKEFKKYKQCFAMKDNVKIKLETEPHYCLGGIKINNYGQTNIKNIYALGECSFGMHGYGRIGGCSLSEIIVMARIIGERLKRR